VIVQDLRSHYTLITKWRKHTVRFAFKNNLIRQDVNNEDVVEFQVLAIVGKKNAVFRDVMPCSFVEVYWRFEGTFYQTLVNFH
jgi:hypothetical protein